MKQSRQSQFFRDIKLSVVLRKQTVDFSSLESNNRRDRTLTIGFFSASMALFLIV